MGRTVGCLLIVLFIVSGCVRVLPGGRLKAAPPGQVQKATGYNPASGKYKGK
jgi:hypothetical protein